MCLVSTDVDLFTYTVAVLATKGDVVKRADSILVYGSTTKGDVVKRYCTVY